VGSARYGARIVTVGYTLLLVFTIGVATAGEDSYGSIKRRGVRRSSPPLRTLGAVRELCVGTETREEASDRHSSRSRLAALLA